METRGVIRFYRASGKYGFLANPYKCKLIVDDVEFDNAESAYQYAKFRDTKARDWAMQAPSPHLVAIVAHGLFKWDVVPNWSTIKLVRMQEVLYNKFVQNPDLKVKLLETGNALLIESSKTDAFWGIGKGNGKNMLGKYLMDTRETIKNEEASINNDFYKKDILQREIELGRRLLW